MTLNALNRKTPRNHTTHTPGRLRAALGTPVLTAALAPVLAALLVATAAGCGGGLEHTVDNSDLSAEQREQVSGQQSAVVAADYEVREQEQEEAQANNRLSAAEGTVSARQHDLAVAKASRDLEEAKSAAAEARKEEAEMAQVVQLAKLELEKLKAVGPSAGESQAQYKERVSEFERQVAERQLKASDAKKDAANKEMKIEDAQRELVAVRAGR